MFNKVIGVVVALVVACTMTVNAEDAVKVLTDDTFKDFVKEKEFVLAEFYAPWCGHCQKLAPEYEKAAQALKDMDNVALAKIDATEEKKLAEEFEVKGFPTLKWFVNGEMKEYTGGRTEQTIITWIKKKTGPPCKTLSNAEELTAFKDSADVVVVGLFDSEEDAKTFNAVAADDDEVPYGIVIGADDEAKKAAGVEGSNKVVLFKKFDEGRADYDGDATDSAALAKFVSGNSLPLIVPFTQESAQKIFGGAVKQHLLIFCDKTKEDVTSKVVDAAKPAAKSNQGDYLFVTIDKTDERILEFFGVTEDDLPTARIVELGDEGMRKFKRSDNDADLTTESFEKFVKEHTAGDLSPDLKSEDIPESQDGDVFVLVGKQFDEIVNKKDTAVLVEFYAPWCGHCKKLAPIYEELGAKYKDREDLIIAKVDGTANEVESVQVSGFPTLKFFPKNSEEIVDYTGGRDLESLVSFLEEKLPELKE